MQFQLLRAILIFAVANSIAAQSVGVVTAPTADCSLEIQNSHKPSRKLQFGDMVNLNHSDVIAHLSSVRISNSECSIPRTKLFIYSGKLTLQLVPQPFNCIGTEDYNDFPVFILGQKYVAYRELAVGPSPSPRSLIIELGSVREQSGALIFAPSSIGFFDPTGRWVPNHGQSLKTWHLSWASDADGKYYRESTSSYSRAEAKQACSNPSLNSREGPMETYYVPESAIIESLPHAALQAREIHYLWDVQRYKDWLKDFCRPPFECHIP